MNRLSRILLAAATALGATALLAAPALGAFGFKDLEVTFTNEDGSTAIQAGAHPFAFTTAFAVNTHLNGEGKEVPDGETKNLTLRQVPGLAGNPLATPLCTNAEFINRIEGAPQCPDSSAVGLAAIRAGFSAPEPSDTGSLHVPVYNLVPPPGAAAKLGFVVLNEPVTIEVGVNQKPPYNIVASLTNIPQVLLFYSSQVTLWGNPVNSAHDSLRGSCLEHEETSEEPISLGSCSVEVPERPFLTMPRSCQGPLPTLLEATSWEQPTAAASRDESLTQGLGGCSKLNFTPKIEARPTSSAAESPAGLDFNLIVADEGLGNPNGIAQSDIKKVEATLPAGVTVNPSAAEGLGVCTKAQYEAASLTAAGCPESAKLGSVSVKTPLLEETLQGSLFLAQQDDPATATPGQENPFDSLIALYILIRSPRYGIFISQAGKVEPNPTTGQLLSTFEGIPELPFSEFRLHFREGPRSPLVTPPLCGTYTTTALLTPWANPSQPTTATASFKVTSGPNGTPCPSAGVPPFNPGFEAGSINNSAGAFSPFYMRLTRRDGEQDMTRFDSVLPPGVTGKIAGVPACPEAAIALAAAKTGRQELAAPSCPAASQIGRVLVGAGVGPALTYVPGQIYLGGPFAGHPLSIAVITPAVAGPFDAGTVVTREALDLDPTTAEVRVDGAASDPIPHILKGIPLKLRDLRIYIDRPGFTLNPTSCDELTVNATLFGGSANPFTSVDDFPAPLVSRYQAASCGSLEFKPKLKLWLKGGTRRNKHPSLRAELKAHPGDANIGRARVILPPTELIDNAHINNPCTRVRFNAGTCPKSSILGRARAFTPLLDEPLEGPVYFRSNGGERLLPDIVADLHGQFRIILVGFIDSKNARIRTTFATVPDAPVSKFVMRLKGGKKGLLVNSQNLCAAKRRAFANFTAHNNDRTTIRPVIKTSCKQTKRHKRAKSRAR